MVFLSLRVQPAFVSMHRPALLIRHTSALSVLCLYGVGNRNVALCILCRAAGHQTGLTASIHSHSIETFKLQLCSVDPPAQEDLIPCAVGLQITQNGRVNHLVWQQFRSAQQAFCRVLTAESPRYYLSAWKPLRCYKQFPSVSQRSGINVTLKVRLYIPSSSDVSVSMAFIRFSSFGTKVKLAFGTGI